VVRGSPRVSRSSGLTTLADTNILIDYLRGRAQAVDLVRRMSDGTDPLGASALSRTELLAGVRDHERSDLDRLFLLLEWAPVTTEIADAAGDYSRRYRSSNQAIDIVDYVVAATASVLGAELLTLNIRDFPMFPGLRAPY